MKTFILILITGLISGCFPGYSDSDDGTGTPVASTSYRESESLKYINTLSSVGKRERLRIASTGKYEILIFTVQVKTDANNEKYIETNDVSVECGTYVTLGPPRNKMYYMTPDAAPTNKYGLTVYDERNPMWPENFITVEKGYTNWTYYTSHRLRPVTVASTLPRCDLN